MYKVAKVIEDDILSEMVEDYHSKTFATKKSTLYQQSDEKGYRTSLNMDCHHRMYPEFCQQLEDFVGDGTEVNQIDVLVYEKGHVFKRHTDYSEKMHTHGNDIWPKRRRVWSTSTILHYSDDYLGDGLRILKDWDDDQAIIPRQEVGDTIIFDSNTTIHEVAPPISGTRLVAVAWLGEV
jgi:hypothetical protein